MAPWTHQGAALCLWGGHSQGLGRRSQVCGQSRHRGRCGEGDNKAAATVKEPRPRRAGSHSSDPPVASSHFTHWDCTRVPV